MEPGKKLRMLSRRSSFSIRLAARRFDRYTIISSSNAEPTVIEKLEINFRRDERVIRFLTFKQDKYAAEYAAKRRSVKSTKKED